MQTDVLIIGGGIAGLACAVALKDSGLHVTVLEKTETLGGRARSWIDSGTDDVVDIGPHILLTEYQNMLALLEKLGTRERIVWHTDKLITLIEQRRVTVMRGYPLSPPLHLVPSLLKVRSLSSRDKLSNARAAWLAMKVDERDVPALDELSASDLLKRLGVSKRFIDWFWKTASLALMNVPLEECSAGSLMRFYGQFLGHNGYSMGFPDCGLSELFVPAAVRNIEAAGGAVRVNSAVREIVQRDQRCIGALLADGTSVSAKFCVSTLPPAELKETLQCQRLPELRNVSAFKPSPYISVYLWFDRKLTQERFWAQVWSPENLNTDFYDLSNIRRGWSARASVIASNIIYSDRVEHLSDREIQEATVREIADFIPEALNARVAHAAVHRIPMAIPCPHPGTEKIRPGARTSLEGFFLAGDWTRTALPCSMESAVRSGFLAAEEIWRELGRERTIAQTPRPTEGLAGIVRRLAHRNGSRPTGHLR